MATRKFLTREQSIYVIASEAYATQGIFKIGRTKSMSCRLGTHNSGRIIGDTYVVLHEFKVYDAVLVEGIVHKKLAPLALAGETEIFMGIYAELIAVVAACIDGDEAANAAANVAIDGRYALECEEFKPEDWMRGIPATVFGAEYHGPTALGKIKVSDMDAAGKATIALQLINAHLAAEIDAPYTLPADASRVMTPKVTIRCSDLMRSLKIQLQRGEWANVNAVEWSALFAAAIGPAVGITYKPYKPKNATSSIGRVNECHYFLYGCQLAAILVMHRPYK